MTSLVGSRVQELFKSLTKISGRKENGSAGAVAFSSAGSTRIDEQETKTSLL